MALEQEFKPIATAILRHLDKKKPDDVIFIVGKKQYKAKDLKKHFSKEDKIAETIIKYALNVNGTICKTLSPNSVSKEQIEKTIKMFEV